jgi:hypothetical protein
LQTSEPDTSNLPEGIEAGVLREQMASCRETDRKLKVFLDVMGGNSANTVSALMFRWLDTRVQRPAHAVAKIGAIVRQQPRPRLCPSRQLIECFPMSHTEGVVLDYKVLSLCPQGGTAGRLENVLDAALEKMGMEFTSGDSPSVRFVKPRKGKGKASK